MTRTFSAQQPPTIRRWRIVEFVRANPDSRAKDIAAALNMDVQALGRDLGYLSRNSILISSTTKPKIWRAM